MEKCSELVMRLNGAEATDGMFDLVFGRNQGDFSPTSFLLSLPYPKRPEGVVIEL